MSGALGAWREYAYDRPAHYYAGEGVNDLPSCKSRVRFRETSPVHGVGRMTVRLCARCLRMRDRVAALPLSRPPLRASAGRPHSEAVLPAAADVGLPAEPPRGSSGRPPSG